VHDTETGLAGTRIAWVKGKRYQTDQEHGAFYANGGMEGSMPAQNLFENIKNLEPL
jgi:hypothetical protein